MNSPRISPSALSGGHAPVLVVRSLSRGATRGLASIGCLRFSCALGRCGSAFVKREGDGRTPRGRWRALEVRYRPDRELRPRSGLPVRRIGQHDGWCDAAGDRNYNRPVRHPYPASAEQMWRADRLYDVLVVLDHNQRPRIKGAGSAIFLHVARPGYEPTAGCLALRRDHLLRVIGLLRAGSVVHVV